MTATMIEQLLVGGPLDGQLRELHPTMATVFVVECPWFYDPERPAAWRHLASATYSSDGHWRETRCSQVHEGEKLFIDRPTGGGSPWRS